MRKHYVQEITKDFQVGMNCRTESSKIIQLGFIDKGTGKHESNIVYSGGGISPTITASFGVKQPPTMVVVND